MVTIKALLSGHILSGWEVRFIFVHHQLKEEPGERTGV